jgi:hypothetical protein
MLLIIKLKCKIICLSKLHATKVQREARGKLHLAVLDKSENQEGRIAFKDMTFTLNSINTSIFSKVTVADRHIHWVEAGTVQF